MKMNFDRKKALVFLIVIGGLIYITKVGLGMTTLNSFLATLGVLLILFVGDNFAQQIDNWLKRRKLNQENEEK
nr:transporter [uncultured Prevotella sp.]